MNNTAKLVLEDGLTLTGQAYGAVGETVGEAVFCTAMTGYQETLTDPSYHKQVVIMTAPHIGNTGVNDEDDESEQMWVAGFVVRDPARRVSNWRSTSTLHQRLAEQNVVGISGVDTRALTKHLRDRGVMRIGIFSGDAADATDTELLTRVMDAPQMAGANLAGEVSTDKTYVVPAQGERKYTVAAIDLGIKGMTPELMAQRGIEVHVMPSTSTLDDVKAINPDGVFFSNGPGDPSTMTGPTSLLKEVLAEKIPFFGICMGNQMFGRALGLETYKLQFGHRGINQPVLDRRTGKVEITAQNHGFAVKAPADTFDTPYGPGEVSHVSLNDQVVEGLSLTETPAFSVQYHPEAAAGPHDSAYLFDRFVDLMSSSSQTTDRK